MQSHPNTPTPVVTFIPHTESVPTLTVTLHTHTHSHTHSHSPHSHPLPLSQSPHSHSPTPHTQSVPALTPTPHTHIHFPHSHPLPTLTPTPHVHTHLSQSTQPHREEYFLIISTIIKTRKWNNSQNNVCRHAEGCMGQYHTCNNYNNNS